MSKLEEGKFQKELIKKLYSQGAWTFNVHGHAMQKSGVADILVVHRRWVGFIELKAEGNKPSAKQKDVAKDLINRYFPTFVVRCVRVCSDVRGEPWDASHHITIENFDGNLICRPAGLDKVLDCLQAITSSESGVPWVKMPKLFADCVRIARKGEAVYFGTKVFLCIED